MNCGGFCPALSFVGVKQLSGSPGLQSLDPGGTVGLMTVGAGAGASEVPLVVAVVVGCRPVVDPTGAGWIVADPVAGTCVVCVTVTAGADVPPLQATAVNATMAVTADAIRRRRCTSSPPALINGAAGREWSRP